MIRPACPQSFEDFLALCEALPGVPPGPHEFAALKKMREKLYRQKAAEESRARRAMARQLAGTLGPDHPRVVAYVAALRAVTEASKRSAEAGANAKLCQDWSTEKLGHAQTLFDRGEMGPDLDALNSARKLVKEAAEHYKAALEYAEEVARYSRDAELLEAALLARKDAAKASRFIAAATALERAASRSVLVVDSLDEFTPPTDRPRTRDTFAHAPPSCFATELRRSTRAQDS